MKAFLTMVSCCLKLAMVSSWSFSSWVRCRRLNSFPEVTEHLRRRCPHFEHRLLVDEEELLERFPMVTHALYTQARALYIPQGRAKNAAIGGLTRPSGSWPLPFERVSATIYC